MGRTVLDGNFEEFQTRILALAVQFGGGQTRWTTLRGETLAFGWSGPLRVNGNEEPMSDFAHYDSPFCLSEAGNTTMEIRYADYAMRLDFSL
jgi:hypothetical protein